MVENLSTLGLEVGAAEGGAIYGAVLVAPEQTELPNASDDSLCLLQDHSLPALLEVGHQLSSLTGERSVKLFNGSVAGEIVIDDFIHLGSAAATVTGSYVAVHPLQVTLTQLDPPSALSHISIYLVKLTDYPALILFQDLLLLLVQFFP